MTSPTPTPPCLGEREAVARFLHDEVNGVGGWDALTDKAKDGWFFAAEKMFSGPLAPLRAERDAAIARAEEQTALRNVVESFKQIEAARDTAITEASTLRAELAQAKAQVAGMRAALVSAEDALSDAASGLSLNDAEGRQNAGQALQGLRNFIARFEEHPHGD